MKCLRNRTRQDPSGGGHRLSRYPERCETLFTTAAEFIEDLSNASQKGRLQEALVTYTHPHVLIID